MTVTKRNVIANFAGQIVSILVSLAFLPLFLPLLGTEAYGLVGFYVALTAVFSLLDAGLGTAASRETARRAAVPAQAGTLGDLIRTLEWIYWPVAAVSAAICWLASPWLATHWLHLEKLSVETATACLRLLGLSLACRLPAGLYSGVLNGLHRQVSQNVLRIVQVLLSAPGSFLLLKYVSRTPETYFQWQLALAAFNVGAIAWLVWRALPRAEVRGQDDDRIPNKPRFIGAELRSIGRFALGSTGIAVLTLILTQTDRLMLSAMVPLASLGIYTLAQSLNSYFSGVMGNVVVALLPRFYELEARGDRVATAQLLHRATAAVGLLLLPLAGLLITRMEDLLGLWLRNPALAAAAADPARWLIAGSVLNSFCTLPYMLVLAKGNTRFGLVQNIIAIALQVPLLYATIRVFGIVGGGMTWFALNAGYYLISSHFVFKGGALSEEKTRWLWRDTGLPLAICVTLFLCSNGIGWPPADATLPLRLLASGTVCLLAAAAVVLCSRHLRELVLTPFTRNRSHFIPISPVPNAASLSAAAGTAVETNSVS